MNTVLDLAIDLLIKAPSILAAGAAAVQSYQDLVAELRRFRDEGRDPDDAERDAIKRDIDALEARIYAQKP